MEHEVAPCSSKICDWPLNSSHDRFGSHQEKKNERVTWNLRSQKVYFKPTLSTILVQQVVWWEKQKRISCSKCQGTMARNLFFFQLFMTNVSIFTKKEKRKKYIYLKNQHIHFLVHGHFIWSIFNLQLVKGPKAFKVQSYIFNMTRLGNEKKVVLSRCHIFNNMTNWTWLSQ